MFQCNKNTQLLGLLCPWTTFYYIILHSFPVKTSGTQCKMQLYSIFNWVVPILPSLIFVRNANSTRINVFDRLINLGFEMGEEIVFLFYKFMLSDHWPRSRLNPFLKHSIARSLARVRPCRMLFFSHSLNRLILLKWMVWWLKVDCQDLTDFCYLDWSIVANTNTNIKEYSRDMIY